MSGAILDCRGVHRCHSRMSSQIIRHQDIAQFNPGPITSRIIPLWIRNGDLASNHASRIFSVRLGTATGRAIQPASHAVWSQGCCLMLPSDPVLGTLSLLSTCISYLGICTSQSKRVHWPSHHSNTTFGSSHTWGEFKGATGRKIPMLLFPQLRLGQIEAEVMAVPQGGATGCHHCSPLAFSGVV